ncbi:MAG: sodium:solute symporter [Candidatus Marinimicrobia bacterium]|nr:sodium:solute symporter [Candidatus Neomarinimicrobiota bacterium]
MNQNADMILYSWIFLAMLVAGILVLVIRGARQTKSIQDYALGSFLFSPAAVGISLAASMTSAATFIINPGFIALYGISAVISYAVVLPIAAMVSLVFLSKGFRKYGTTVKVMTLAQWMGVRYHSKAYQTFFAFLSLLLITFIVLIVVGLTKVLASTLAISEIAALLGIVIFIFGYMMFGGANSMVYTNTIQGSIMIVVAFLLLGSGYEHFSDGIHGFLNKLSTIDPKLVGVTNTSSFLFRDWFEIGIVQIIVGVAIVCQPHIITKSLLLKDDKSVNKFLIVAVVTELLFFSVVITGLYARIAFPDLLVNGTALRMDGIIPAYVLQEFPVFIGLIVILGLIAAGLSTLEGLIQSLSTTITNDLIKPALVKFKGLTLSDNEMIKINRLVIVLLAIVSIYLSRQQLLFPKLSVAIFAQNGVYAFFAAAFFPILFGMFSKQTPAHAAIAASVTAVVVHFSMYYGQIPVPFTLATGENPGVAAAIAIVMSLLIGSIVLYFSKEVTND